MERIRYKEKSKALAAQATLQRKCLGRVIKERDTALATIAVSEAETVEALAALAEAVRVSDEFEQRFINASNNRNRMYWGLEAANKELIELKAKLLEQVQ